MGKRLIRLTESDIHRIVKECIGSILIREGDEPKREWNGVLRDMLFYKRKEGYVDELNGRLTFFDSDPCINGVHAFYVTLDDVKNIINGTY